MSANDYIEAIYQKYILDNTHECFRKLNDNVEKFGFSHDYWSLYILGNEARFVYFKTGYIYPDESIEENFKFKKNNNHFSDNSERFSSSLSRTKSRVYEIAKCNEFDFFCTFTLDENKQNRYDLPEFVKNLSQMFRDLNKKREDNIKYLLVPEQHKKGGWHLHGLLNGLTDSDLVPFKKSEYIPKKLKKSIENGEIIYNFPLYQKKFGFFTATKIKDKDATCRYITKYITKDLQAQTLDSNKHLFYASKGLKHKVCIVKNSFDRPPFDSWDYENEYVKIKTVKMN